MSKSAACEKLVETVWREILAKVDTFLFDADGVLWHGNRPIPGSAETVNKLAQMGKTVVLVTNNSTKSRLQYNDKCERLGFTALKERNIVTPSAVLAEYLQRMKFKGKVYFIGGSGIKNELDRAGIPNIGFGSDHFESYAEDEDFIYEVPLDPEVRAVAVGFDGKFSYVKCMKAASYLLNPECLFIATNCDETIPSGGPTFVMPGTGSIVAMVRESSRRKPVVLGKPEEPMFKSIQSLCGVSVDPEKTLMVGDRCSTDIKFARNNNLFSLMVQSGDSSLSEVRENLAKGAMSLVPNYYTATLGDVLAMMDT